MYIADLDHRDCNKSANSLGLVTIGNDFYWKLYEIREPENYLYICIFSMDKLTNPESNSIHAIRWNGETAIVTSSNIVPLF